MPKFSITRGIKSVQKSSINFVSKNDEIHSPIINKLIIKLLGALVWKTTNTQQLKKLSKKILT